MDPDLPRGTVNRDFEGMLERRALLYDVVAQESEATALREDDGFVVNRAVLEMEHQLAGYPITTCDLDEVTVRQGVALQGAEHEKAMDQALRVVHGHQCRVQPARLEEHGPGQQKGKPPECAVRVSSSLWSTDFSAQREMHQAHGSAGHKGLLSLRGTPFSTLR